MRTPHRGELLKFIMQKPRRFGQVIGIAPEAIETYCRYHAALWPDLVPVLKEAGLANYSIFLKDDRLFAFFEYHGENFEQDMAKVAAHPRIKEWWAIMEPMQRPLATRAPGEWWANMQEVFRLD